MRQYSVCCSSPIPKTSVKSQEKHESSLNRETLHKTHDHWSSKLSWSPNTSRVWHSVIARRSLRTCDDYRYIISWNRKRIPHGLLGNRSTYRFRFSPVHHCWFNCCNKCPILMSDANKSKPPRVCTEEGANHQEPWRMGTAASGGQGVPWSSKEDRVALCE